MADQCFYNGNFYQCVTPTNAGDSPDSAPQAWSLVQIPAAWRWVLARLTYANLLELDGQKDKANAERQNALQDDRNGLDWVIRQQANNERYLERPSVVQRRFT